MPLLSKPEQKVPEPYRPPVELDSALPQKASRNQWHMAIMAFAAYACVSMFLAWVRPDLDATLGDSGRDAARRYGQLVGTVIGSFIWPLVVVGVSCLWKNKRTERAMVRVFFVATVTLLGLHIAATVAAIGVREYVRSAPSIPER